MHRYDIDIPASEHGRVRLSKLTGHDVAVFDRLLNLSHFPVQADAYVSIFCLTGKAQFVLEGKEYTLEPNDLFLCRPNLLIEHARQSDDLSIRGLLLSPQFLESIFTLGGHWWDAHRVLVDNPVMHLDQDEADTFLMNFYTLSKKLSSPKRPHYTEMLQLLVQSMAYEFCDIIQSKVDVTCFGFTSSECIFYKFMKLVEECTPQHREIGFYADKLSITPKYLSSICKQHSGRTALSVISQYTVSWLKRELRTTDKSVKQIANEASFNNLSFFGKYLKREIGLSPREYRAHEARQGVTL